MTAEYSLQIAGMIQNLWRRYTISLIYISRITFPSSLRRSTFSSSQDHLLFFWTMAINLFRFVLSLLVACVLISTVAAESQGRREKFAERSQRKGYNPRLKNRNPDSSPKYIKRASVTITSSAATAPAPTATAPYVFFLHLSRSAVMILPVVTPFQILLYVSKLFETLRWDNGSQAREANMRSLSRCVSFFLLASSRPKFRLLS